MGSCEDTCVFANRPNKKHGISNGFKMQVIYIFVVLSVTVFYDPKEIRIQSVGNEHASDCSALLKQGVPSLKNCILGMKMLNFFQVS